ncbi:hypothetical protein Y024_5635 [Burkholderia pseudomallei TSV44]|nr:hypothetical protein Y024_5635 [Burkholderia pseudomallei TSV44]KOT03463.1 hypothetical protein DM77_3090 [Burkholderia mallei]
MNENLAPYAASGARPRFEGGRTGAAERRIAAFYREAPPIQTKWRIRWQFVTSFRPPSSEKKAARRPTPRLFARATGVPGAPGRRTPVRLLQ